MEADELNTAMLQMQQDKMDLLQEVGLLHMQLSRIQADARRLQLELENKNRTIESLRSELIEGDFEEDEEVGSEVEVVASGEDWRKGADG